MEALTANLATSLSVQDIHSQLYNVAFSYAHRDLYDRIFDACSPASMFRLGRVGTLSRAAQKDYMKRAFDVNKHFGRFFADPLSFRQLQAATSLVVSGSNALQFMNRCVYPEADLDLYVDVQHAYMVCKWLVDRRQMYTFNPGEGQDRDIEIAWNQFEDVLDNFILPLEGSSPGFHRADSADGIYRINSVVAVWSFTRRSSIDPSLERKVQVIMTGRNPLVCILTFHSTAVMNAITHEAAYALFPNATFEENITLLTTKESIKRDQAIQKYAARGWKAVSTISSEDQENKNAPLRSGKRWISDNQTWIIPLDASGVGSGDDPILNGSFDLYHNTQDRTSEMRFVYVVDSALSKPLILNEEFGIKVKAYIRLVTDLYGTSNGIWDPDFYDEDQHNIEEEVTEWNEMCKGVCNCTGSTPRYLDTLHDQMPSCPAFIEMMKRCRILRLLVINPGLRNRMTSS